jgi:hypothetical protein
MGCTWLATLHFTKVKLLQQPRLVHTFTRKGRFKGLMEWMPIHIITARAALAGAATFGLQSLGKLKNREEAKASLAPCLVGVARY